jgi:hypothetical protein
MIHMKILAGFWIHEKYGNKFFKNLFYIFGYVLEPCKKIKFWLLKIS